MVLLLRDKRAKTVHYAIIQIIKTKRAIPMIIYCDQGSEFKNKLFDDPKSNGFRVQFTIDRCKAVYTERAIHTIRRSLEQLYLLRPTTDIQTAMSQVVQSHNNAPSRRNPLLNNGIHATPGEVITDPIIADEMEKYLGKDEKIKTNINKKSHPKKTKFKVGDTVRYIERRSKFSKETSLTGNWSDKLY